ncbi:XkdF-like putative serine protease domain-containing protein [Lactococcus lactis]|uniref:XkdF-like putative serine protease domain-containing protein n=1 Tax=Lactococcus lactis TaxID=1358 RepID=UPI0025A2B226|nr:XkdF-like putative serine protease domain-containing protein [Lactococcus lactis]MDM7545230.1 XkdF-like putative serine protease domain-containing protein [Lactococcus lactis]
MRKLENVKVTHVSYVDKAANKKQFFLTKSASKPTFETTVKLLTKSDDPQKLVYGVVYEPEVEDVHGDFMDSDTIEKAAHGFMEDYQQIDKQHDFTTNAGKVVESYVAPVDMTIGETTITKGTWVLVTKATDELWESIQKGEFTGYSLAGTAEVEEVKKQTTDNFNNSKMYRDINAALDAFRSATWNILDNYAIDDSTRIEGIQKEISELSALINSFQTTQPLTKQGLISTVKSFFNLKKQEEVEMTQEELKKALGDAFAPINDRLEALEKAAKDPKADPNDDPKADGKKKKVKTDDDEETTLDEKAVAKAVSEAIAPMAGRLEALEKARVSNATEIISETVKKSATPSYVDALFPIED